MDSSAWRKSRRSMANGNCAEIGAWRTSSFSFSNGNCAEAGTGDGVVGVRDTKLGADSPVLEFTPGAWRTFLATLRD